MHLLGLLRYFNVSLLKQGPIPFRRSATSCDTFRNFLQSSTVTLHWNMQSMSPCTFQSTRNLCQSYYFFFFWRNSSQLAIHEVSGSHVTTHHSQQDSSGRVISSSQGPLPSNTQHSQQRDIHDPSGIRTQNLSRRVATLDRADTGTGLLLIRGVLI